MNIFKFNSDLTVDQVQLQADIAQYGLFTLEESEYLDEDEFEMFNMKYYKLMIGKGLTTREQLIEDLFEIYDSSVMLMSNSNNPNDYAVGSIILDTNTVVKDNKVNDANNNIYLSERTKVYVVDGATEINAGVTLNGGTGEFSSEVFANNIGFFSDNAEYVVKRVGNEETPTYTYSLETGYTASKVPTTSGSFSLSSSGYAADTTNGSLFVPEGTEITITPTADTGYEIDKVEWKKASDSGYTTITNNNGYKFTMTAEKVYVKVSFKASKSTPTASDFNYNSSTGVVSSKSGKDLGIVTTYYKVNGSWTTTKPTANGTYDVGVVTTGSSTYNAIGSASAPLTNSSWTYTVSASEQHTHTFATTWSKDATYHWHAATCAHTSEVSAKVTHTYGAWSSNNDATTSADGTKSRTCSVCGYKQTVTDEGSKKEDNGAVKVPEDKQDGNFAAGGIKNSEEEVKNAVLTDEDKAAIAAGKDVNVWVEIEDMSSTVSSQDKAKVKNKLPDDYEVGIYLDVSLWKQVTGSDATKVTETPNGKVKIGFTIPKDLQKEGRTYKIIRIHDGVATIIDAVVDGEFNVTFETDQFSTYALIYEDKASDSSNTSNKDKGDVKSPKTGDSNDVWYWLLLMMTGFGLIGFVILFGKKRKEEQE